MTEKRCIGFDDMVADLSRLIGDAMALGTATDVRAAVILYW